MEVCIEMLVEYVTWLQTWKEAVAAKMRQQFCEVECAACERRPHVAEEDTGGVLCSYAASVSIEQGSICKLG
jgi:hypothetical protein